MSSKDRSAPVPVRQASADTAWGWAKLTEALEANDSAEATEQLWDANAGEEDDEGNKEGDWVDGITLKLFAPPMLSGTLGSGEVVRYDFHTRHRRLEILLMSGEIRRFELKGPLDPTVGYADAYHLKCSEGSYAIDEDTVFPVYDGYLSRRGWAHTELLQGTVGYVAKFTDCDRWEIISIEQLPERIEVTLTEDMGYSVAGRAACTVNNYYRGGTDPTAILDPISVYDPQSHFPRALSGAKGMATYDPFRDQYILTKCQQVCWMMIATANTVEPGAAVITFTGATMMLPFTGQTPSPVPTQCNNTFSLVCSSGATVLIWWNETAVRWEGLVLDPVWLEAITDLRYYASSHELQKKITESLVLYKKDEGDWASWHSAVSSKRVDSLQYDASDHQLELKKKEAYVLEEADEDSSWTLWHTAVDVSPATSLTYDTSDHKFKKKTTKNYVLEKEAEGDWGAGWYTAILVTPMDDIQLGASAIQARDRNAYVLETGAQTAWTNKIDTTECP